MKKFIGLTLVAVVMVLITSCTQKPHDFVGKFTDEFGNQFELREDHTATIHFSGTEKVNETVWRDTVYHEKPVATIEFNGDPAYYYLREGSLYRHVEDMKEGRCAIVIQYEE